MAILAWSYDHRLRHVYALSLPIQRWRYVMHAIHRRSDVARAAGRALFVGTEIVAHSSLVPKTLHAYPVALTLRFAFATLVAYAVFFAISSATAKTAGYILATIGLVFVAADRAASRREASVNLAGLSRRSFARHARAARGVRRTLDAHRCL